jgi:hypothetical protein
VALGDPSAGTAPTSIAGAARTVSSVSGRVDATALEPQGLEDSVPSPRAKTARKRGAGARPKTKVGRAVLANSDSIVLTAQAAISVIEITIENLRAQRDNHPEAPSNMAITRLEPVIDELRNIQKVVEGFREDKVPETKLPGAFDKFRLAFAAFWEKDGDKLIGQSASLGLICAATVLLHHAGMPNVGAGLIASAVCAGGPVAKVLRAAKGLWPGS